MITPFEIPCVILCGGKSSRMGEDKALLPFSSSNTLSQYQFNRLKPYFKKIYISSKVDKFDFLNDEEKKRVLILDKGDEYSPIIALKTILESVNSDSVFILTVDTPFVKIDTIKKLLEESKSYDITIAQTSRIHNLCGVFNKTCLLTIKSMLKNDIHKVGFLIKQQNYNIVNFGDDIEFLNLNDKEEYNKAILHIS